MTGGLTRRPAAEMAARDVPRAAISPRNRRTTAITQHETEIFDFAPDFRRGPLAVLERVIQLDYARPYAGRGWLLNPADHPGRTPLQAYRSLRESARRSGARVTVSRLPEGILVRTKLVKPVSHTDFGILMMCAKSGIHPREFGYDVRARPEPDGNGEAGPEARDQAAVDEVEAP
jgi:hypothetical protein